MHLEDKVTPFLSVADTATVDHSLASTVWSLLPSDSKQSEMTSTERASGLVSLTDATAAYGQSYYNSGYSTATGYGVYGTNPANYYQQTLRLQNAAAVPYALSTSMYYPTSTYAAGLNFPDYSAYNSQYYSGMRTAATNGFNYTNNNNNSYTASTVAVDVSSDPSSFVQKEKKGKCAKKKKSGSCSPEDEKYARVFIWDLDTISAYSSQTLNAVAHKSPMYAGYIQTMKQFLSRIIGLTFTASDQQEDFDVCQIDDACTEDTVTDASIVDGRGGVETMRRLATKYGTLKQLYIEISNKNELAVSALIDRCGMSMQKQDILEAISQLDAFNGCRTLHAKECLQIVQQKSASSVSDKYGNVIMCSDGIVSAVAQLLLCGYAATVPIEHIYSYSKSAKDAVLDRIQSKMGKKCSYVMVSSNRDTAEVAAKESIPVWPVTSSDDLNKLLSAQKYYLLGSPIL